MRRTSPTKYASIGSQNLPSYKFLHAADIHLDSPLRGLSRYEGVPADEVRLATRTALDNLVDTAIQEEVAFVIIAGDLYDGDWPDFGTGLFFCAAMGRLGKAGIDVFLLYGNHDAESVLTRKLPLPVNVHVFGSRKASTIVHQATGAALHGWSYREKDTRDNLAASYPATATGRLNIGVLHTALSGGRPPHAGYAPCTVQELAAKGYDYWALGHVHDFELVSTSPLIVFPGNLQGRHIREVGPKGAVIVTVENDHIAGQPTHVALDAVRWTRIDVDAAGTDSDTDLHRRVRTALNDGFEEHSHGRALIVRLTIAGETPMHGALARRRDVLREEVRSLAVAISEKLWIEKVVVRTTAGAAEAQNAGELHDDMTILLAESVADPELNAALAEELAEFFAKVPPDLGGDDALFTALRNGNPAELIRDAAASLQARLAGEPA